MIRAAIYLFLMVLLQSGYSWSAEPPEAAITVTVVDEAGKAVKGAKAGVTFRLPRATGSGMEDVTVEKVTDGTGSATLRHGSLLRLGYGVTREGYYPSYGEYLFTGTDGARWLPDNPGVVVTLRKIGSPVAMYARDSRKSPLPLLDPDKEIGFDLIEYDWVSPYGKGSHSDFIFKSSVAYRSPDDYSYCLKLSFPGELDGIQLVKEDLDSGSVFKLPRSAPGGDYLRSLTRCRIKEPGKGIVDDYREDNNYIFRVRSEAKDGKLVRALYGKIQEDVRLAVTKSLQSAVLFRYYLNPDYSRNLEFDPNANLFVDLQPLERVGLR